MKSFIYALILLSASQVGFAAYGLQNFSPTQVRVIMGVHLLCFISILTALVVKMRR